MLRAAIRALQPSMWYGARVLGGPAVGGGYIYFRPQASEEVLRPTWAQQPSRNTKMAADSRRAPSDDVRGGAADIYRQPIPPPSPSWLPLESHWSTCTLQRCEEVIIKHHFLPVLHDAHGGERSPGHLQKPQEDSQRGWEEPLYVGGKLRQQDRQPHKELTQPAISLRCCIPQTELGAGLAGFGIFFLIFGILLYFDTVLLAFGNILFMLGLTLIIGLRRTYSFFFQKQKLKGSSFFLGGILLVLLRWPLIGMLCEFYGFISLFRGFFPTVFGFLASLGNIPLLTWLLQKLAGGDSNMV
uniref:Golgi transport 1A n=1 Tax=Leptobrachium leishanense TaxID=445787 RepID=A0A8C5P9A4_9ANUR